MSLFCKSKMVIFAMSELEVPFLETYCRTVADLEPAEGVKGGEVMIRLSRKTEIADFCPEDQQVVRGISSAVGRTSISECLNPALRSVRVDCIIPRHDQFLFASRHSRTAQISSRALQDCWLSSATRYRCR